MAVAARGNILDVVANLGVTLGNGGCELDLSVVLDAAKCPTLDLYLPKPHTWEAPSDEYIHIVPTQQKMMMERTAYKPQSWCPSTGVSIDILGLINLGVLTQAQAQIYINLLNAIKAEIDIDIDLSINLLGLIGINIGNQHVNKCVKHFQPHCHKKIPDTTPGCKKFTSPSATDCLNKCHAYAAGLDISANVQVGNLASIIDCTAISFDPTISIDNCLAVTVGNVISLLVDAEVDTLIRL